MITLATMLEINFKKQKWKQEDQVRDNGTLDYHRGVDQNRGSKSCKKLRFWICIEGTVDRTF